MWVYINQYPLIIDGKQKPLKALSIDFTSRRWEFTVVKWFAPSSFPSYLKFDFRFYFYFFSISYCFSPTFFRLLCFPMECIWHKSERKVHRHITYTSPTAHACAFVSAPQRLFMRFASVGKYYMQAILTWASPLCHNFSWTYVCPFLIAWRYIQF